MKQHQVKFRISIRPFPVRIFRGLAKRARTRDRKRVPGEFRGVVFRAGGGFCCDLLLGGVSGTTRDSHVRCAIRVTSPASTCMESTRSFEGEVRRPTFGTRQGITTLGVVITDDLKVFEIPCGKLNDCLVFVR